jgi:hypothetical protein
MKRSLEGFLILTKPIAFVSRSMEAESSHYLISFPFIKNGSFILPSPNKEIVCLLSVFSTAQYLEESMNRPLFIIEQSNSHVYLIEEVKAQY